MEMFLCDPTSWMYLFSLIVCLYGAGLFIWWWGKNGSASSVFVYVTLIFLGEFVESAMSIYARHLKALHGLEEYTCYVASNWFAARKLVTIFALISIAVHMSHRAFCRKERRDGKSKH